MNIHIFFLRLISNCEYSWWEQLPASWDSFLMIISLSKLSYHLTCTDSINSCLHLSHRSTGYWYFPCCRYKCFWHEKFIVYIFVPIGCKFQLIEYSFLWKESRIRNPVLYLIRQINWQVGELKNGLNKSIQNCTKTDYYQFHQLKVLVICEHFALIIHMVYLSIYF